MNLSRVVTSPRLGQQAFTIMRQAGTFGLGGFTSTPTAISATGIVTPTSSRDLMLMPEGNRITGSMTFHSTTQIQQSVEGPPAQNPDVILWNGHRLKVMYVFPWEAYGYSKAIAVYEDS